MPHRKVTEAHELWHTHNAAREANLTHQPSDIPGYNLKYVDRPDVAETFADSLERITFDGMSLRMEFVVNRIGSSRSKVATTGSKVTAARLVLPMTGVVQLLSQLNQVIAALKLQGALKDVTLVHPPDEVN